MPIQAVLRDVEFGSLEPFYLWFFEVPFQHLVPTLTPLKMFFCDLLPEKFYCKDNVWNTAASSCDAPEDEWDNGDPLVDSNGKVESSPMRKRKTGSLSPLDEKNFRVGGMSLSACFCDIVFLVIVF